VPSTWEKELAVFSHPEELIPALQALQDKIGYLPPEALRDVARHFRLPESTVFGVVSFYSQFYLTRQGRHKIRVCCGTACHVRGAGRILQALQNKLGIASGETTENFEFTSERGACFGSCALAPVVVVNGRVYGNMTPEKVLTIVSELE